MSEIGQFLPDVWKAENAATTAALSQSLSKQGRG
jgi:hypothetical protein